MTVPADPIDVACTLAARLPQADITKLAHAVAQGEGAVHALRARAASQVMRRACDQVLDCLLLVSSDYLAGALTAASVGANRAKQVQHIDVVWTGPNSGVHTSRLTSSVVVSLIDEATTEIVLVSYATHSETKISQALHRAAERGVEITLLLENHDDNPSYTSTYTPFPGLSARRWTWPLGRRDTSSALHAKILLVDAKTALVGSANITQRAMESNLECGLLIRGGPHPRAIRKHLLSLKAQGVLV
ncbi:DISARM system phospholipase D-like protein DrmC [Microbispora hainanensis]|uniref:DISARM system phospholipase D-like protein DrmC n=1 Tax=Microbispora hainanensis TaxID=568844 RepID=UPI0033F7BEE1